MEKHWSWSFTALSHTLMINWEPVNFNFLKRQLSFFFKTSRHDKYSPFFLMLLSFPPTFLLVKELSAFSFITLGWSICSDCAQTPFCLSPHQNSEPFKLLSSLTLLSNNLVAGSGHSSVWETVILLSEESL